MTLIINSESPVIKLQSLAVITRVYVLFVPRAKCSVGTLVRNRCGTVWEESTNDAEFPKLTIQFIQSLASVDADLSSLLIDCLGVMLRLDPLIVNTTVAMDLALHFLMTYPANPMVRDELLELLDKEVLRKVWSPEDTGKGSLGDRELGWLGKAVEMVNIAAQRPKDDSLTPVWIFTCGTDEKVATGLLAAFLNHWIGPLPAGIVTAVFPALAGILLREDDAEILTVLPS